MEKKKAFKKNSFNWACCLLFLFMVTGCAKDDDVAIASIDDFAGMWQCEEFDNNQLLIAIFQVEILLHPTVSNKILIDNFNLLGVGFQAEGIISNTQVQLDLQNIGGISVSGSGFLSDKKQKIEMQYTIDEGTGQEETITATFTKI